MPLGFLHLCFYSLNFSKSLLSDGKDWIQSHSSNNICSRRIIPSLCPCMWNENQGTKMFSIIDIHRHSWHSVSENPAKNEPSDLLCLLWTIPALSCVWKLHRQWLFSHCFLYHSRGHILSEMWITNNQTLRAKLEMGWRYCITFFCMTTDVLQRPFLLQILWNPHLWHQFWECSQRGPWKTWISFSFGRVRKLIFVLQTQLLKALLFFFFLWNLCLTLQPLLSKELGEIRLHTLSEHVVLSVHWDVWARAV